MELNSYQLQVIADLNKYLECVEAENDLKISWQNYWQAKNKPVGFGSTPAYKNKIPRVPHICMKVPTGGGKTFLACASLEPIYKKLLHANAKVVVWLVPSEAILTQTIAALSNTDHPYRKKIEEDFQSKVEIYTKEMLLQAQNFSPDNTNENLSICIFSYDSIRSQKKEGRKVYQENAALENFAQYFGTEDTSLINILRQYSPLIVVDESHNATSDLSVEMLQTLNPSFILELTATPKTTSNIISYVDARALKKENMVKLPVVVYKKNSVNEVITAAISMRNKIELQAAENEKYIRPIVLLQAQPNKGEESETFDKIKNFLLKIGIPKEQIAIKTSDKNDLKGVNLLSESCPIRYIITVNALKEGWDCPFAYILASVANKSSLVDVEQVVGRILRQPYAQKHSAPLLNLAYVFGCYKDFNATIDKVVAGMKASGFTKDECRAAPIPPIQENIEQQTLQLENETEVASGDNLSELDADTTPPILPENDSDVDAAISQAEDFEEIFTEGETVILNDSQFAIREDFKESVTNLKIPQFFKTAPKNIFDDRPIFLECVHLQEGFNLATADANVNLNVDPSDVAKVDIQERGDAVPYYKIVRGKEREKFVSYLNTLPEDRKVNQCVNAIAQIISGSTGISQRDVQSYVKRIIATMDTGKLAAISTDFQFYAIKIQEKIRSLLNEYRKQKFGTLFDTEKIICQNNFNLLPVIDVTKKIDSLQKSLYTSEVEDMNKLERRMVDEFETFEKVKWWHRNTTHEFKLNGYINHYPDFLVMLQNGKVLMIETKGDDRDNSDSREKLELGRKWQVRAGSNYKYFMVFDKNKIDGAYNFNEFLEVVSEL